MERAERGARVWIGYFERLRHIVPPDLLPHTDFVGGMLCRLLLQREHTVGLSRLAQLIAPEYVSEQTALRYARMLEQGGYVTIERSSSQRSQQVRLTEAGLALTEKIASGVAEVIEAAGWAVPDHETAPFCVSWYDADFCVVDVVRTVDLLGWPREALIGQRLGFLSADPTLGPALRARIRADVTGECMITFRWTARTADGRTIPCYSRAMREETGDERTVYRIETHVVG